MSCRYLIAMSGLVFWLCGHESYGSEFDKQVDLHVKVLCEEIPVEGASIKGGFTRRMGGDKPIIQYVLTNSNGVAQVSAATSGQVALEVTKEGYYKHYESLNLYNRLWDGPVSTNLAVELKKILTPVPMYAKNERICIPEMERKIGYDITCGDWISPWGKGTKSDFDFQINYDFDDDYNYKVSLLVSFRNPHDGIQSFNSRYSKHEGTSLRSPHKAPPNGYVSSLTLLRTCKNGQVITEETVGGYYFRLNTVVDDSGKFISAQYGKIYGDILFDRFRSLLFNYYFNPDKTRNMEFDMKKNLFLEKHTGRIPICFDIAVP